MALKDYFQRASNAKLEVTQAASAALQPEEFAMSKPETGEAELLAASLQREAELSASKQQLEAALASALSEKSTALSNIATISQELEALKATVTLSVEDKRRTMLASVLPEDQVDGVLSSTKGLEASSFDVVFGALKAKSAVEAKAFGEVGYVGVDATKLDYAEALAANAKATQKGK